MIILSPQLLLIAINIFVKSSLELHAQFLQSCKILF